MSTPQLLSTKYIFESKDFSLIDLRQLRYQLFIKFRYNIGSMLINYRVVAMTSGVKYVPCSSDYIRPFIDRPTREPRTGEGLNHANEQRNYRKNLPN
jgi:hypothetical protein